MKSYLRVISPKMSGISLVFDSESSAQAFMDHNDHFWLCTYHPIRSGCLIDVDASFDKLLGSHNVSLFKKEGLTNIFNWKRYF